MLATLSNFLVFAEETGNGRGENPAGGGGVLIIVGILVLVVIVVLSVVMLLRKRGGREGESPAMDDTEHRPGGVGRAS